MSWFKKFLGFFTSSPQVSPKTSLKSSNITSASNPNERSQSSKKMPNTSNNSQPNPPVIASKTIKVTIETINHATSEVFFSQEDTGFAIKSYIFQNLTKTLQINQMSVKYQGTNIGNYRKLSEIQIVVGTQMKIVQQKIDIAEVSSIIADINKEDAISGQKGVAKMCCGHDIGRDTMTTFVRSLISFNSYEIRCPFPDQNANICNTAWEFKSCRKIGVFTKEQIQEFQKGLSQNWMKKFAKQCPNPNCKETIYKGDLKTDRVVCPKCHFGDFCFLCLKKWVGGTICGNEDCKFLATYIQNAEFNRKFKLTNRTTNKVQDYLTPQYRACPHCSCIIEHRIDCKHMKCKGCEKKFCWVCLSVPDGKGNWSCFGPFDYCGKVAQRQKLGANV